MRASVLNMTSSIRQVLARVASIRNADLPFEAYAVTSGVSNRLLKAFDVQLPTTQNCSELHPSGEINWKAAD